jgi:ADP-ribosylglycohydrolase
MRLTPVVLAYAGEPLQAIEKAAESSRTTHGSPMCIDACRYYAALIVGIVPSLVLLLKGGMPSGLS